MLAQGQGLAPGPDNDEVEVMVVSEVSVGVCDDAFRQLDQRFQRALNDDASKWCLLFYLYCIVLI